MSSFNFLGKQVHYEVDGLGTPLIILNGIMMSTKSWQPFIPTLSEHFQVIRLDFFDQGTSDKLFNEKYTQRIQVDLVEALLNHLGIDKVDVVGISYGGEVALQFAIYCSSRVNRLLLFNTAPNTNAWLTEIGRAWMDTGKTRNGEHYYRTTIPVIYSPHFYEEQLDWMKKREQVLIPIFSNLEFLDQMERLTLSAESFDVRSQLHLIHCPTLIISAEEDYLTPLPNQEYLHKNIKDSLWMKIPYAGHASMYEKPLLFTTLITGFFGVKDTIYHI